MGNTVGFISEKGNASFPFNLNEIKVKCKKQSLARAHVCCYINDICYQQLPTATVILVQNFLCSCLYAEKRTCFGIHIYFWCGCRIRRLRTVEAKCKKTWFWFFFWMRLNGRFWRAVMYFIIKFYNRWGKVNSYDNLLIFTVKRTCKKSWKG